MLVVGASGRTGRLLVRLALRRGHDVTAFVRSDAGWRAPRGGLTVTVGDAMRPETLVSAVAGQDAVISLLAPRPRRSGVVYVEGTRNLADAAVRAGVRRFVAVSAEGAGVDPATLPLIYRIVLRIPVVARLYPDIARMERDLSGRRDLDWTIVAPPILIGGPYTGRYRVQVGGGVPGGLWLSRRDLAAFLLDTVEADAFVHERVAVAR
jgi:putative NADH-flavin reductase